MDNKRFDFAGRPMHLAASSSEESSSSESSEEMSIDMRNKMHMLASAFVPPQQSLAQHQPLTPQEQVKAALNNKFPQATTNTNAAPTLLSMKSDIPNLTSKPVDQGILTVTSQKGLQTTVPNGRVITLTPKDYQQQQQKTNTNTNSLLTPLTEEDYFRPSTLSSMGLGALPLGNGKKCASGHNYEKKTQPRVLAPFGDQNTTTSTSTKGVDLSCGACETAQQKSDRIRRQRLMGNATASPLTEKDKLLYSSSKSAEKPLVFSMDATRIDRLATQFAFIDQLSSKSSSTATLFKTGGTQNLACAYAEGEPGGVAHHLKKNHPEFFQLLKVNGLLDRVNLETVLVVVPDLAALKELPQDASDKATADALRYHLVQDKGKPFQQVEGMESYDTMLMGQQVQVERLDIGAHTINGKLLRSDPTRDFISRIYHIRGGLLKPEDVMPVQQETDKEQEKQTGEGEQSDQKEQQQQQEKEEGTGDVTTPTTTTTTTPEEETPTTEQGPTTESETTAGTSSFQLRHVNSKTQFQRKVLSPVVDRMTQPFYKGSISLASYSGLQQVQVTKLERPRDVCIKVGCFNTDRLYKDYRANKMNELARVAPTNHYELRFPANTSTQAHIKYDPLTRFTEYECNVMICPQMITHSKLANGVMALSFNSPHSNDGGGHTVSLCRLETPANMDVSNGATATTVFMSPDENVIMRFTVGSLRTICINHEALAAAKNAGKSVAGLSKEHFLELATEKHDDAFYYNVLNKQQFDDLLMTHASVKKFVKKAKRYGGKAISKGKRVVGKATSSRLQQASASVLAPAETALASLDTSQGGASESLRVVQYGKSNKVRSTSKPSQLSLKKFDLQVGKENILVYVPDDAGNQIASDYGTGGLTKYVHFTLSDHPAMHVDVSHLPSNKASEVYYVTSGGDLVVYRFGSDGSLTALYAIPKHHDLAKRLMQSRTK
jgi:hypothetical protein